MSAPVLLHPLREAYNVADAKERDRLVRRLRKQRDEVEQARRDIQYWNRAHPDELPISHDFEDAMLLFLDRKGPMHGGAR